MTELLAHLNERYWMGGWGAPWMMLQLALIWWLIVDTTRRRRGWLRWIIFAWLLWLIAIVVWLIRRRKWPATVSLDAHAKLRLAGLALVVWLVQMAVPTALTYQFQVARVDGRAMEATLNDQDRLLVNKAVYRGQDPGHGDIVMLRYPKNPEKKFVMRIIGVGGDELRMENGAVFRNGTPLDEPYVLEADRSADDMLPRQIPPGFYFVMGDRRNNSSDSRHWGVVPREYVLGKVTRRWWPVSQARTFD